VNENVGVNARCRWCGWSKWYPTVEAARRGNDGHLGATVHTLGCRIGLDRFGREDDVQGVIARMAKLRAGDLSGALMTQYGGRVKSGEADGVDS
jgi:hypothetical protein